ncbi:MAG TPA: MFS transporter [Actinomycetota bacterium]|nr:MFS transporter [Actinomycetota bacterium]
MTTARALIPPLPRRAWIFLAGNGLSALGTGMVLPFFVIYFHQGRGMPLEVAALGLSVLAFFGFVGGLGAGPFVDRAGGRLAMVGFLVVSAAGSVLTAWAHETWQMFVAAAMMGAGISGFWPSLSAVFATIVPREQTSAVFAVHYMTLNAGIGAGGIVGGLIVDVARVETFQAVYLLDAATFLLFAGLLVFFMKDIGARLERAAEERRDQGGYREVLKDRRFRRVVFLMVLLVTIGYSQLTAAFPVFATGIGGVSTRVVGLAFSVNTFMVVAAQLFVLRFLEGRRRTRAVAILSLLWALCWGLSLLAGHAGGGSLAAAGFMAAMALFALGETFVSPTMAPMVNDLAPKHLLGRYMSLHTLSWSVGEVAGPAVAGAALGAGRSTLFFLSLIAACGVAAVLALRLERCLPPEANVVRSAANEDAGTPPETGITTVVTHETAGQEL